MEAERIETRGLSPAASANLRELAGALREAEGAAAAGTLIVVRALTGLAQVLREWTQAAQAQGARDG